MKLLYGIIIMLLISIGSFAQEKLEKMPQIKGGIEELAKNIKYPASAKEEGIEGTVYVRAVIDESGLVSSAEVVKSVNKELDEAAIKAVKSIEFIPAEKEGEKIKAEVTIPIKFKLDDCKKKS